ncbi:retrovirus-related Pol polyprotein from transposon 17.6 [Trichonephila clavipes]|nr:retrovirus-related Pol polyprotein from transposon 17.6 [Trichonephila clavipes]
MKTVTYRPQVKLTERVNRNLVQMIACFVKENHENRYRFLHEFAFALRTSVNETINKTPAELFLGRKIITPFSKLINVTEGAEYVERNIEKFSMKQGRIGGNYTNISENIIIGKGGKFMPKCKGSYRVLEVRNNNLIIFKKGKRVTVNINQERVYRPRESDTISLDSHLETLYERQRSSDRSSRSKPGKFKGSKKTSSEESNGHKSSKGNAGWEDPRL